MGLEDKILSSPPPSFFLFHECLRGSVLFFKKENGLHGIADNTYSWHTLKEEEEHNSEGHSLGVRCTSDFPPEDSVEGAWGEFDSGDKPTVPPRWISSASTVMSCWWPMPLTQDRTWWEGHFTVWLLPPSPSPSLTLRKAPYRPKVGMFYKIPALLQAVKVIKTKDCLRSHHSPEESEEMRGPYVVWDPGWSPGKGKNLKGETKDNQVWTLVKNNVPVVVHLL